MAEQKFVNMTKAPIHVRDTMLLPGVEDVISDEDQKLAGFALMLKAKEIVPFTDPAAQAQADRVAAEKAAAEKAEAEARAEAERKKAGGKA